ncbi:MAG: sodium/solute symporter [Prolixibacteraceae bacterium]|jgi:solute:Na+ symporter, SSS family|nr:sodium/solute symporter [Prolixibacteraceae bacterium]MBT6998496.1 sodium/solute symporter [Prolixibacteraceae bacterium]MBT7397137.1 sodium/solute symporter [Prolixibacteraceae bacterium]
MKFSTIDVFVFVGYAVLVVGAALYVSRTKKGYKKTAKDYFLADKSLPWWAVGASLIAANISAEQFIGVSGSGYAIGLAMASYEWTAAIALIIIAKYFLPIFLKNNIFTMPQFLELRFDVRVRTVLAVFWILLYVFVYLTSVLYLGALFMQTVFNIELIYGIIILAAFSALYSIYGGLKAVAWTDVIQVVFLIGGGILTTVLALNHLSDGTGIINGLTILIDDVPEKFHMIIKKGQLMIPDGKGGIKDAWMDLPGLSVLIGGLWIGHFAYWGCNQYITQKAIAAKSLYEAQKGLLFAGYLKILLPFIVVVPGIVAFSLNADIAKSDEAYPWLLQSFVPSGFRGAAVAALIAAIVSSLSSMINSTATIFSMDIYKPFINPKVSDHQLVQTGRISGFVAIVIAVIIAKPLLGNLDQVFQYIQEYTGFTTPAIFAIFIFGLFWKRATPNSVLWASILAIPLSLGFKMLAPGLPFMNRWAVVFLILGIVIIGISLFESDKNDPKGIEIDNKLFYTGNVFNIGAVGIFTILAVLYIAFW